MRRALSPAARVSRRLSAHIPQLPARPTCPIRPSRPNRSRLWVHDECRPGPNQPSRSRPAAIGCGSAGRAACLACHLIGRFGSLFPVLEGAWAGLSFGQDLLVDQAFQFGADAFGFFGFGADAQGEADPFVALQPVVQAAGGLPGHRAARGTRASQPRFGRLVGAADAMGWKADGPLRSSPTFGVG